ncbi:MAG: serine/threonine-protein phosphatase [Candidatus Nealsonbacteria bacterium]|nr:serine/threonine-protein phosphatase [Candidatus Nealsonbacteria bacterium]
MSQQTTNWDHCLQHAAISDVGLRRANNQDSMAVVLAGTNELFRKQGHLFIVADGMGAHAAGELASQLSTETITQTYSKLLHLPPPQAILAATHDANAKIHGRGEADEEFRGMGTTTTSLLLLGEGAVLAHVGDSRAYRLRGSRFEQLTFDHSLVWEMKAAGQLPEGMSADHIPKNIITRSLGPNATVAVDLEGPFPLAVGDTFLLCSDGLSGPVADEEIGIILASMAPDEAVRALVDLANLRGGPDNITAVIARVTGPQVAQQPDDDPQPQPQQPTARPVHPIVWTLLVLFLVGAAGLAANGMMIPALVSLALAAGAGIAALVQRQGGESEGQFSGQPLGKGPYSVYKVAVNPEFVQRLGQIIIELRGAATAGGWVVDWDRFNADSAQAAAAVEADDHVKAVRDYFHAISFMMSELKQQRRSSGEDVFGP